MGTLEIPYKNVQSLTKTVELPYYCKHKLADMYYKILSEKETVMYMPTSIGYHSTNVCDFSDLIEISKSEFEAFASETEKFILAKLNKTEIKETNKCNCRNSGNCRYECIIAGTKEICRYSEKPD